MNYRMKKITGKKSYRIVYVGPIVKNRGLEEICYGNQGFR